MNIKLNKLNTLFTLLGLLTIASLSATTILELGKVTVDKTTSNDNISIAISKENEGTFEDLYTALTIDVNLSDVLLDTNNSSNKFTHLYYGNKKLSIDASDTLKSLGIKANQAIKLTTAAPQSKKNTKTNPTNTNNGNDDGGDNDDDKKGLWKNHKYKILGTAGVGTILLVGGAYFMLNSGQESETEKA